MVIIPKIIIIMMSFLLQYFPEVFLGRRDSQFHAAATGDASVLHSHLFLSGILVCLFVFIFHFCLFIGLFVCSYRWHFRAALASLFVRIPCLFVFFCLFVFLFLFLFVGLFFFRFCLFVCLQLLATLPFLFLSGFLVCLFFLLLLIFVFFFLFLYFCLFIYMFFKIQFVLFCFVSSSPPTCHPSHLLLSSMVLCLSVGVLCLCVSCFCVCVFLLHCCRINDNNCEFASDDDFLLISNHFHLASCEYFAFLWVVASPLQYAVNHNLTALHPANQKSDKLRKFNKLQNYRDYTDIP